MSTHEPRQTLKNAINSSPIQAYRIERPFPVPIKDSQGLIPLTQDGSRVNDVKRILQINGRSDLSGGPIAMFRLLQEMHDQPFQHTVVCPKNSNGILKDLEKLKHVQTECMELRRISPSSIVKLYRLLSAQSFDLIHCHGKAAGLYGRVLGRWFGVPVIHQFHGLHYRHYLPGLREAYLYIERLLSKITEHIICVSESECAEAESLRLFKPGKGLVIPNGVDGAQFQSNAEQRNTLRNKWKIPQEAWVLLSITRANFQKDLEMTLAVHQSVRREHPKCVLVLAGVKAEELQRLVRKKIPCDSSHVICAPPEHSMERLINVADCYLSTSRWEGFSLGLIEALAMNLPAVISRVTGNLDFIGLESEGVFLVSQTSPESYSKTIQRIFQSDIHGKSARSTVLKRYSQKKIKQMFSNLYFNIMGDFEMENKANRISIQNK